MTNGNCQSRPTTVCPSKVIGMAVERHGVYKGNVMTPLQFSTFVRATNESECNGMTFKVGELREFDLKPFRALNGHHGIGQAIINEVSGDGHPCIVYLWRSRKLTYGVSITNTKNQVMCRILIGHGAYKEGVVLFLEDCAGITPMSTPRIITITSS